MAQNSFDSVTNSPEIINVNGQDVEVHEVLVGQLKPFAAACAPFFDHFEKQSLSGGRFDASQLVKLFTEFTPDFVEAVALVTNVDKVWLNRLPPDQFFLLAEKVVEVNMRFFIQRLAPTLVRFAQAVFVTGSTLSKS